MGETSTVESLPAVMIGAAVGTVFGIWRIVEVDAKRHRESRSTRTTSSTSGLGAASMRCWSSWPASQRG